MKKKKLDYTKMLNSMDCRKVVEVMKNGKKKERIFCRPKNELNDIKSGLRKL